MTRTRVGIIRGGTGSESDLSLKTGAALMLSLPEEEYEVRDILIDKEGLWHSRGLPAQPAQALSHIDIAVNALHGGIGEDGTIGKILERSGVAFTGSNARGASQSLNKARARSLFLRNGLKMPKGAVFRVYEGTTVNASHMAQEVFSSFSPPYILKPVYEGASHGIMIARTIIDLHDMLADMLRLYKAVLVEEYIRGQEATVGVVENFREDDMYALPPAEVGLPTGHLFVPSDAYRARVEVRAPAPQFSYETKQLLMHLAKEAHKALGLEHYSRSDFIVAPHGIYLLETNALPGLYDGAAMPRLLDVVGSSVPEFTRHVIDRELSVV